MANVLFSRTDSPSTKPITDGQIIFDTSGNGKMYLDNGTTRLEMGGAINVDATLDANSTNPIQNKGVAGVMLSELEEVRGVTKKGFLTDALATKTLDAKIGTTDISSIGDGTVTGAISDVNGKLVASDNTPFRFGVNKNGEYGYIVTDSEGADSVVPFKTDNLTLVAKNYSYQGAGTSCSYTCTKNCKIGVFGTAFSAGTNGSYGGSHVYVNGAEQSISRIAVESDATRGVFFTVINAKKGDVILVKAGINSGNNYLHSICIFATE